MLKIYKINLITFKIAQICILEYDIDHISYKSRDLPWQVPTV